MSVGYYNVFDKDFNRLYQQQVDRLHGTVVGVPVKHSGCDEWLDVTWDSAAPDYSVSGWVCNDYVWSIPSALQGLADVSPQPTFSGNPYYTSSNIYFPALAPKIGVGGVLESRGNCTWYALGRALERASALHLDTNLLSKIVGGGIPAQGWGKSYQDLTGIDPAKNFPSVGAIAWLKGVKSDGSDSHVAFVESLNDDNTITITESVYIGGDPGTDQWNILWRNRTVASNKFTGFIPLQTSTPADGRPKPSTAISLRMPVKELGSTSVPNISHVQRSLLALKWPLGVSSTQRQILEPYQSFSRVGQVGSRYSTGITIPSAAGVPVTAAADGSLVSFIRAGAGKDHGYGNVAVVSHLGGLFTLYGGLGNVEPGLWDQISARCRSSDQIVFTCDQGLMPVAAGQQLGSVGNVVWSKGSVAGMRFEVKTFASLSAPGVHPPEYGYTSVLPDALGYRDPIEYLQGAVPLTHPTRTTVTTAGSGTSLKIGPNGQYTAVGVLEDHDEFWARMMAPATPDCSMGWYEVYRGSADDPAYPPSTPLAYITGPNGQMPTAWACRGNNGEQWLN